MSTESLQHKLDRVRRPRVQLTYDVETGGAMEKKELPFVLGALADLSGQPKEPRKPLRDRKFVPIDRDNFNEVLEKSSPRVAFKVDNTLSDDDSRLPVELNFSSVDDFEPARIARQIPALRELLEMRERLSELMGKMEGNDRLDQLLFEIMENSERASALSEELAATGAAAVSRDEGGTMPDASAEDDDPEKGSGPA